MYPDDPDQLRRRIWDLTELREHAAALEAKELTAALPPPGNSPDDLTAQCLFDVGFAIEYFGDDAAAVSLYRRVLLYPVAHSKYVASAWFRTGVCMARQGNLAEAVRCYRATLPLAGDTPHLLTLTHLYLAELLEAAEEYDEAATLYERLIAWLPHPDISPAKAKLGYGRCCWRLRRSARATELLTPIAEDREEPLAAEAWRLLAEIAEAAQDRAGAERAYREIIQSDHAETALRAAAAFRLNAMGR